MLKALILKPMYHSFQAPAPSVYRPDFNITDDALLNVGWMILKMDDEIGDDHFGLCCCLVTRVIYWCTFMDVKERLFSQIQFDIIMILLFLFSPYFWTNALFHIASTFDPLGPFSRKPFKCVQFKFAIWLWSQTYNICYFDFLLLQTNWLQGECAKLEGER